MDDKVCTQAHLLYGRRFLCRIHTDVRDLQLDPLRPCPRGAGTAEKIPETRGIRGEIPATAR